MINYILLEIIKICGIISASCILLSILNIVLMGAISRLDNGFSD